MAGFYLIAAEDPQVRQAGVTHAKSRISLVPCTWVSETRDGLDIVFATLPHTPFSRYEEADGTLTLLLGRPIADDGVITAKEIAAYVARGEVPWLSGLFAWFSLGPEGSFRVGGDPFSILPVFYSEANGRLEMASSPAAIDSQPGFQQALDPIGLARYLMGNGSSGERSLDRGIRRLKNGCELRVSDRGRVEIASGSRFSPAGGTPPHSFDASCQEANALLASACRRHGRSERSDLLLSGGLDSRLILAHLVALGNAPRCLSRGYPGDDEVIFARKSARKAGCEWELMRDDFSRIRAAAAAEIGLFSLHGGFATVLTMTDILAPTPRAAQTFNGFFMDSIFDPFAGIADESKPRGFEAEFKRKMNSFGIAPGRLKAMLIDAGHRQAVDEAVAEMRAEWDGLSENPRIRIWQMLQHFRTNHHIGGIVWKNSFVSWPVFPSLDVPMIRRLMDFPVAHFRQRALERAMLARMNPALAKIPLDGNSLHPRPVIDTPGARLGRECRILRARWFPRTASQDTRRYHRVLNMNAEAWKDLRKQTDGLRGSLEEIFHRKKLAVYFPRSRKPVPVEKDAISEHGGRRMLAGLALYLARNGSGKTE
ncbi:MAG: asparagine synthase-related protein [Verrucomicrobiota bacterium]